MNIYLIRHGQTTGDVENRYGGDYDDHLTNLGRRQSKAIAKKLSRKGIEVIYCSPLIRARETAEIIRGEIPVGLAVIKNFKERNRYGTLTGLTKNEATQKFPDQVKLLPDERSTLKDAEDYEIFGRRIHESLQKIDNGKFKTVAVVTHGGPVRYIFREILKEGEIEIGDCNYALITKNGNGYKLVELDGIKINT